ncbi:MAG: Bug family tripartite tricarboxylate transporter substrate binding protein [Acetobacteraceae bacterium]
MSMIRRLSRRLAMIALASLGLPLAQGTAATDTKWPERPVKVIVPFGAGGPNDTVARLWVDRLSHAFGQQFVIENRGGASGMIGSEAAARSLPDGYTLLLASSSTLGLVPLVAKVNFNPLKDFTPMARVGDLIQGLAVNPAVPARTVSDLIAVAKAQPGKLAWGTPGSGTGSHLMVVNFNRRAGVDILHVPYRGSADALNDVLAGHVQIMSDIVVLPHVRAGKLRLLAMVGNERHPDFPDTPTLAEQGFPDITPITFYGIYGPARVSRDIVDKVNARVSEIMKDPTMVRHSLERGVMLVPMDGDGVGKALAAQTEINKELVKAAGLKMGE